jgi:hypothetical protein
MSRKEDSGGKEQLLTEKEIFSEDSNPDEEDLEEHSMVYEETEDSYSSDDHSHYEEKEKMQKALSKQDERVSFLRNLKFRSNCSKESSRSEKEMSSIRPTKLTNTGTSLRS